jgi:hypothetical protein
VSQGAEQWNPVFLAMISVSVIMLKRKSFKSGARTLRYLDQKHKVFDFSVSVTPGDEDTLGALGSLKIPLFNITLPATKYTTICGSSA